MAKEQDLAAEKLEKLKVLQAAISKIEKNYGKGSIMKLGDKAVEE
ncbi:MAG: DNA recombination/repair protein RecA, partial [Bacteroidales bacterium]|nr:DNA recombination/repair protein RecA [Bacteroidales bacterium]